MKTHSVLVVLQFDTLSCCCVQLADFLIYTGIGRISFQGNMVTLSSSLLWRNAVIGVLTTGQANAINQLTNH